MSRSREWGGVAMSAHERRVLADMARELAAQDHELAQALRTWSEPVSDVGGPDPAEQPMPWWRNLARRCLRDPAAVAVAAGLLIVGGLLVTAQVPAEHGGVRAPVEAAIFTEHIPEPLTGASGEP